MGRPEAAAWAAAAAAEACAAAACAAAAFYAAAFMAAALYAAALYAAVAYIERRAIPAIEKGVQGIPIIASAFLTNPNLNGVSGRKLATDTITKTTVSIMDTKNLLIAWLLSSTCKL